MIKAEILSTGDEIRSGALIDSNTAYIAEKLEENGIEVTRHTSCGDDMDELISIVKEMSSRADVVIVTGGLGPTTDDLTTEAAAKAAGVDLVLDADSLDEIRSRFLKFDRPMSPSNEKQALFPVGAQILKNPVGTAPGFSLTIGTCTFFFAPGVPFEMKEMLATHIIPSILLIQGNTRSFSLVKTICVFGMGESIVGEKVAEVENEFKEIKLGLRATFPEVLVKLYIRGDDEAALKKILEDATKWVLERIGTQVFSTEGESMEQVVGRLLVSGNSTLALAESCTGGQISDLITNIPGSSKFFLFSGVTYSNDSKIKVLGVTEQTLKDFGAVSEETVAQMARGAREISGASYAIATSGIAGPDGGTEEKPVGTVCIAIASQKGITTKRFVSSSSKFKQDAQSRERNKKWFAIMALDILRKELLA